MDKRTSKFAVATLIAAAAGYVAGVLTAPKSGKETRKDIKDVAQSKITELEKRLKSIHTELSSQLTKAKKQAGDLKGKAKKEADTLIERATKAKDKTRVALSSIHGGEADDKELQKAIDDAEKAVEHLKQYIIKK